LDAKIMLCTICKLAVQSIFYTGIFKCKPLRRFAPCRLDADILGRAAW